MSAVTTDPTDPTPPPALREAAARPVLEQKIWRRANVENKHYMGCLVGGEGEGKSHTALRIGELVDPTFRADRVFFDPIDLIERLDSGRHEAGHFYVLDEAGVGLGVRSWYEKDQILLNQVLQTIRDDNLGCLFTLPRFTELDSQTRGRMHALITMMDLDKINSVATVRYQNIKPTRDEKDKLYKPYPRLRVNGEVRRITRLGFKPPDADLASAYEERKASWKADLYEQVISQAREDRDDSGKKATPKDIAERIKSEYDIEDFISTNRSNGMRYLDKDKIEMEFGASVRGARKVKKLLEADEEVTVPG